MFVNQVLMSKDNLTLFISAADDGLFVLNNTDYEIWNTTYNFIL